MIGLPLRIYSWLRGWLAEIVVVGIVLAAFAGGVWYYGHTRYKDGEAAVEARWAVERQTLADAAAAAQAAADATVARQTEVAAIAAENYNHAQTEIARLAGVNAGLARRLQDRLRADRDRVPAADPDPAEPESPGDGVVSVPVELVVRGLAEFSGACARSRDELAAQVNGLLEAWPR